MNIKKLSIILVFLFNTSLHAMEIARHLLLHAVVDGAMHGAEHLAMSLEDKVTHKDERSRREALSTFLGTLLAHNQFNVLREMGYIYKASSCLIVNEEGTHSLLSNFMKLFQSEDSQELGNDSKRHVIKGYITYFKTHSQILFTSQGKIGNLPTLIDIKTNQDQLLRYYQSELDGLERSMLGVFSKVTGDSPAFALGTALGINLFNTICAYVTKGNIYLYKHNDLYILPGRESSTLLTAAIYAINNPTCAADFEKILGTGARRKAFSGFIEYLKQSPIILTSKSQIGHVPIPDLSNVAFRLFCQEEFASLQKIMIKKYTAKQLDNK